MQEQIKILNELIEINNDRIAGYDTALLETKSASLKHLFSVLGGTSQNNLAELQEEVRTLEGEPSSETGVKGKLYRIWMDLKSALSGQDEKTILDSCLYGEQQILEFYQESIEQTPAVLSARQLLLLQNQRQELQKDYNNVEALIASDSPSDLRNLPTDNHGFSIGDPVHQEFGSQAMTVIAFEPELVENVITQWEDELGNVITGKFMEAQLIAGHPITQ